MTSASTSSNVAPLSIISAMRDCRLPVVMWCLLARQPPEEVSADGCSPPDHTTSPEGPEQAPWLDPPSEYTARRPAFPQRACEAAGIIPRAPAGTTCSGAWRVKASSHVQPLTLGHRADRLAFRKAHRREEPAAARISPVALARQYLS